MQGSTDLQPFYNVDMHLKTILVASLFSIFYDVRTTSTA